MSIIENNQTVSPAATQSKVEQKKGRVLEAKQPKVVAPALQPVGADEKVTRSTTFIQPKVVMDTFSFRLVEKGPRYVKSVEFDFSDCTDEDMINLALQSVRIDLQAQLRALKEGALNPELFKKCNVKLDIINKSRDAIDPNVAAARRLMTALGCTYDDAIAIVERELAKRAK